MRSLTNFLGDLRTSALSPLTAFVLIFGLLLGTAGQVDAQTSGYTLNDVMNKLIEMDKRLVRVETKVDMLEKRIDGLEKRIDGLEKRIEGLEFSMNGRMSSLNTTMISLFGILGALFAGILAFVFSIARSLKPEPREDFQKRLDEMTEQMREFARRQEALERKLSAPG